MKGVRVRRRPRRTHPFRQILFAFAIISIYFYCTYCVYCLFATYFHTYTNSWTIGTFICPRELTNLKIRNPSTWKPFCFFAVYVWFHICKCMDLMGFSEKSHKLHQVKDVTIALLGFVFGKREQLVSPNRWISDPVWRTCKGVTKVPRGSKTIELMPKGAQIKYRFSCSMPLLYFLYALFISNRNIWNYKLNKIQFILFDFNLKITF